MSFEELDLDPSLDQALAKMGYQAPTTIQREAIPAAMDQRDILGCAPTGTGKTAAFLLPALQHLIDFPRVKPGPPRVLIITPTRELANQVHEYALALTEFTALHPICITGGIDYDLHEEMLEKNSDVLVATPGRLMEFIDSEQLDMRSIEFLIMDEADRMLDMGFINEMERVADEARWRLQTMLYSATLEGKGLERFVATVLKDPIRVDANPSRKESAKIVQWVHLADNIEHKQQLLAHLLNSKELERTIVFVKTRERLAELVAKLQSLDIQVCYLQGKMAQDKRNLSLERFKTGELNILVATDVAARGLDIDDITHVINYDLPYTSDVYLHRIGRTGRAGKKGIAISLVEAHDVKVLGKIERYTDQRIRRRSIDGLRAKNKEARVVSKKKKVKLTTAQKKAKAKKQLKKVKKKQKKS
ncbi:ATP-dependent RNA helicase SrmB [Psychrobium sp. 1_MG-2023]|uniref:ATP-dependent RNA helicase SrmB n=1 Tax=Psychrobium sp. 1_MG-2023 TaxID=3062624 RepID=UPI000C3278AD|nr:ATP-dependent RNA helicase SrmB [Psychrobium sp. 1_MG-2023]MDP2560053.1 ATP-dependent RNA helicase SrmB [Psychrobium sp. 1_MG-2023]PKF56286.1 ATP-dependent RNA helicase SrmB [Alteromonadales bacterium alter-6D02]